MSLHKATVFYGVATALITPFQNGEIDYGALEVLIERQVEGGADAVLIAGTTGESVTLEYDEHRNVIAFAKACLHGRLPLLAGCGSNSTARAVELARAACESGADALLAVTPYYNKASHQGLVLHYQRIADAATRPLMLYNVPARTGVCITIEQYRTLAKHPNVVGVKESSGDLGLLDRLICECGDDLDVYVGNDDQFLSALKLGACGVVSVYSNLYPAQMKELYHSHTEGRRHDAARLQAALLQRQQALFLEVNPIPVKYLASRMGLCACEYRLPLTPPSPQTERRLQELFETDDL